MNNLKAIRDIKKISQEHIALSLNVSRQIVGKWENGDKIPEKRLTEIANLLDVEPSDLISIGDLKKVEVNHIKKEIIRLELRLKELLGL